MDFQSIALSEEDMKLSIIVPVYNERTTIKEIFQKLIRVPVEKEIIIVDDGSKDGTTEILKEIQMTTGEQNLKIIFKSKNEGKGSAIREGLKYVSGDVVVIQDADLEYDPMDFIKLSKPIEEGKAEVVYGSRILGKNPKSSFSFYLGGRLLSWISNILYRTSITDEPTCYKMFKTDVIKSINLRCKGFEFCPEVTAKLAKRGIKIHEIPIKYNPRSKREGKKIKWKDGLIAIWVLLKNRF